VQKGATQSTTNKEGDTHSTGGGQTRSLINEKRMQSMMLSHKETTGYGEEYEASGDEYQGLYRSQSIYQRQRRGSFHSMLVVDTLKFLNDDTDVVTKKRGESLFTENQYKTSPPSEVFNMAGGADHHQ
jgi:hypothetical protein